MKKFQVLYNPGREIPLFRFVPLNGYQPQVEMGITDPHPTQGKGVQGSRQEAWGTQAMPSVQWVMHIGVLSGS